MGNVSECCCIAMDLGALSNIEKWVDAVLEACGGGRLSPGAGRGSRRDRTTGSVNRAPSSRGDRQRSEPIRDHRRGVFLRSDWPLVRYRSCRDDRRAAWARVLRCHAGGTKARGITFRMPQLPCSLVWNFATDTPYWSSTVYSSKLLTWPPAGQCREGSVESGTETRILCTSAPSVTSDGGGTRSPVRPKVCASRALCSPSLSKVCT